MDKILDCTSAKSAVYSIANLLETDVDRLCSFLGDLGPLPETVAPEHYISQKVYSELTRPIFPVASLWFHASRVEEPSNFKKEGIMPTSIMRDRLYKTLRELSQGLKHNGEYPNSMSAYAKQEINDEGPFAFLFKSVAIKAPGAHHSYHQAPELVEDIAGELLGANYTQLVYRFLNKTKPCIVSFHANANENAVNSALWFAYLISTGSDDLEASDSANTCFSGDGVAVSPDDIVSVEILD